MRARATLPRWPCAPSRRVIKAANGWLTVAWVGLVPVVVLTGIKHSIEFVAFTMVWTAAWSHYNSWLAIDVAPGEP